MNIKKIGISLIATFLILYFLLLCIRDKVMIKSYEHNKNKSYIESFDYWIKESK